MKRQFIPDHYAQSPDGLLFLADGLTKMRIWDGLTANTELAGLGAPTETPALASGTLSGSIAGSYQVYVRFVDKRGNFSDLSPATSVVEANSATGIVTITTAPNTISPTIITTVAAHGLSAGDKVKIIGALGNTAINGTFTVLADPSPTSTTFGIDVDSNGEYTANSAVAQPGTDKLVVSNVHSSADTNPHGWSKVTRRQILRNTDGQLTTFYVEVDTTDLATTSFELTKTDTELSALTAVPLLEPDGALSANRYGIPPNFKRAIQHHLNRMFAAVEVDYRQGSVQVTNGSATVTGVGTEWTTEMAGRLLYVVGATETYEISSVDSATQLTLTENYDDSTDAFASYAIRPTRAQRRLVYYTESGLSEAWPAVNAFEIQEDGDELTGLMTKGSFIYILEQRHIYRFTFQSNPAVDGFQFLSAERGCINQRSWVKVEDRAYMLDFAGIHAFTGQEQAIPVSQPIQNIFDPESDSPFRINWQAAETFHAAHYPPEETVRFFVCLSGHYLPRHALVFDYRDNCWWIEEYPWPVGASATGNLFGARRLFLAGEGRKTWLAGSGTLDGVDPSEGTVRGTVDSATVASITDGDAAFVSSFVGKPLVIIEGRGRGQERLIHEVDGTTLKVDQPWLVTPNGTSVYQVGGISWRFVSQVFRYEDDRDMQEERRIGVHYEPAAAASTFTIRIFENHSQSPKQFGYMRKRSASEGFGSEDGQSELTGNFADFDGFAQQRLPRYRAKHLTGARFMEFELSGVSNADRNTVYGIELDGVR